MPGPEFALPHASCCRTVSQRLRQILPPSCPGRDREEQGCTWTLSCSNYPKLGGSPFTDSAFLPNSLESLCALGVLMISMCTKTQDASRERRCRNFTRSSWKQGNAGARPTYASGRSSRQGKRNEANTDGIRERCLGLERMHVLNSHVLAITY